jgi:hypothetical protein
MSNASYIFLVEGLTDVDYEKDKERIDTAAVRAVNATADRARSRSATEMKRRINFPASYLQGSGDRLTVTKRATRGDQEAVITGRSRATSLARFGAKKEGSGVRVEVGKGRSTLIKNSFLMPLKSGAEAAGNLGLAVRTKAGQRPHKAYKPVKISERLWLLYGPSVDQVFKQVRDEVTPDAINYFELEFNRLFEGDF